MTSELILWQRKLSSHIRDPEAFAGPEDVDAKRLKIYRDLFFNTVEGFLSTAFPVSRSLYQEEEWQALIRDFMRCHYCASPFFVQLAEEFLEYLGQERSTQDQDPPFLLELAHYEWVELALDVSTEELPPAGERPANILRSRLRLSPLAWPLAYQFPVHRVSASYRPVAEAEPTFLLVYRNRADEVGFMEINAATARLLTLLEEQGGVVSTALDALAGELGSSVDRLQGFAVELLHDMLSRDILLADVAE